MKSSSSVISRRSMTPPALYDKWFIFSALGLIVIGLLVMASASIGISDQRFHDPFFYFYRQLIVFIVGALLGSAVIQFEVVFWKKISGFLLLAVLCLLALVLIPGIGRTVNGSTRWIGMGTFSLQISEAAKFVLIVYMAGYLVRRHDEVRQKFSGFLKPMLVISIVSVLLLREPDFGATVVIIATSLGMMFLAGMRLRDFMLLF